MIDVLFLVLPDTLLLDLAGPAEAFRLANQALELRHRQPAFRLRYVGPQAGAATSVGATLAAIEPLPGGFERPTWLVLLGQPSGSESPLRRPLPRPWSDARRWLARCVAPALGDDLRLLTVCAGALLAADAGLLAGRRCTTHHEMLAQLQALAPSAQVLANRVFVVDGALASSAGITAGIDLALHLIGAECGDDVAAAVAQTMVVFQRRGPDDPQLSPLLAGRHHLHPAVHRVQDALCERPGAAWPLAAMAAIAHVTPRHLSRLFSVHVGRSPRQYLQAVRVAVAERALRAGQPPKQALNAAGIGGTRQWRRLRAQRPETRTPARR